MNNQKIINLFTREYQRKVSDLHLSPGLPPLLRINGKLVPIEDYGRLTPEDTADAANYLLSAEQYKRFERDGDIDVSNFISTDMRARINIYRQRGSIAIAMRINSTNVRPIAELGLPESVMSMCGLNKGLILITGPTGVGKTTTMAAMIDWMNKNVEKHIVTIEDPIEFMFRHNKCMINQRQIGTDAKTFASALKSVLRQDPDVIMVGEMRDLESIATAITAAETGHLVISSLHTIGAAKTIDRIIDVFPSQQQQQIRIQLSMVLAGIISQQLIPRADGDGRLLATEIMLASPAVKNMIRNEKTHQLQNIIATSTRQGMQTMDVSLAEFLRNGDITESDAFAYCMDPEAMQKTIEEIRIEKKRRALMT